MVYFWSETLVYFWSEINKFILFYHIYSLFILINISLIISLIPYLRLIPETYYLRLELIWKNYFPLVYYGLAICFGLVHLSNFQNLRIAHYLVFPLIVSNQIIMGLMFGYVRVTYKNGFLYSVLLHFFINLPLIWLAHLWHSWLIITTKYFLEEKREGKRKLKTT